MNNLFSIFDPSSLGHFSLHWLSLLGVLVLSPSKFWVADSAVFNSLKVVLSGVKQEFETIMGGITKPGSVFLMVGLFYYILLVNILGLFPFVFSVSSHISFTVALALPLWVGHVLYSILLQPQLMLGHLVPLGTPGALMPFMVCIELMSTIIRPLTLSIRLMANMVAGHLLLTLLGNNFFSPWAFFVLGGMLCLMILESAVALIQSYVFSVLSTLYVAEVQSVKIMM